MLLVSDREDAQNLPRIVGEERLLVCSPDAAGAVADAIVIVDVDLDDKQKRKCLKRLFRDRKPGRSLAVAVDFASVTHRHAARKLGATTLLGQPVTAGSLHRFIHELKPGRNPGPVESAITEGATVLADIFDAVRRDRQLDLRPVRLVCADIADAVAQFGAETWLSSVASTHDGAFRQSLATAGLASCFARQIGMGAADVALLTTAALLLDIGTAHLPQSLVAATGLATAEEQVLYHRHAADAADYLTRRSDLPEAVVNAIRNHHASLDDGGAEDAGAGKISDLTRVLTECDLFAGLVDACRHDPALSLGEALDVLNVMAREKKIAAGHVAVFEAAFAGSLGWPEREPDEAAKAS